MSSSFERRRTPSDRRRARRAPFVAAVRKYVGEETHLALAQDLTPTGMRLRRRPGRVYAPRTAVQVVFELPDGGELIRARARVVFERSDGHFQATGLRFDGLPSTVRARIASFLGVAA